MTTAARGARSREGLPAPPGARGHRRRAGGGAAHRRSPGHGEADGRCSQSHRPEAPSPGRVKGYSRLGTVAEIRPGSQTPGALPTHKAGTLSLSPQMRCSTDLVGHEGAATLGSSEQHFTHSPFGLCPVSLIPQEVGRGPDSLARSLPQHHTLLVHFQHLQPKCIKH